MRGRGDRPEPGSATTVELFGGRRLGPVYGPDPSDRLADGLSRRR